MPQTLKNLENSRTNTFYNKAENTVCTLYIPYTVHTVHCTAACKISNKCLSMVLRDRKRNL